LSSSAQTGPPAHRLSDDDLVDEELSILPVEGGSPRAETWWKGAGL